MGNSFSRQTCSPRGVLAVRRCARDKVGIHTAMAWCDPSVLSQQPAKKATRKSKKSCELIEPSVLKSALGFREKKAARKSKKSCELAAPLALKSAGHSTVTVSSAFS